MTFYDNWLGMWDQATNRRWLRLQHHRRRALRLEDGSTLVVPFGAVHQHFNTGQATARYFSAMSVHLEHMELLPDIARRAHGFVGADLMKLNREGALSALRRSSASILDRPSLASYPTRRHCDRANSACTCRLDCPMQPIARRSYGSTCARRRSCTRSNVTGLQRSPR